MCILRRSCVQGACDTDESVQFPSSPSQPLFGPSLDTSWNEGHLTIQTTTAKNSDCICFGIHGYWNGLAWGGAWSTSLIVLQVREKRLLMRTPFCSPFRQTLFQKVTRRGTASKRTERLNTSQKPAIMSRVCDCADSFSFGAFECADFINSFWYLR